MSSVLILPHRQKQLYQEIRSKFNIIDKNTESQPPPTYTHRSSQATRIAPFKNLNAQINLQKNKNKIKKSATASLMQYLIESQYHIACLQDTNLTGSRPHGLPRGWLVG